MKLRMFGRSGLRVSEIGLGAGLFGGHPGHLGKSRPGVGHDTAREVFGAFADAGGTFIDTAEGYQAGQSEVLVGELVKQRRDDFVIATKYGIGEDRTEGNARLGNSRKAVRRAIEGSLRRLQTDYVDLYWIHGTDHVTPTEELVVILDDLIREGKVLYGGLSNLPAWRVSRAVALVEANHLAPVTAITAEYGLAERSAERELLPMAEALGLGFAAWSPLSSGFLTSGDEPGVEARLLHWEDAGRPTPLDYGVRSAVNAVAADLGVSAARVGMAWMLGRAQGSTSALVPITSADTVDQLTDTLAALELSLDDEHVRRLESATAFELGQPHQHNQHSELYFGLADVIRPAGPIR